MVTIHITDSEGEEHTLTGAGLSAQEATESLDSILERHGFDPESVDASVESGMAERLERLESAAGVNGQGKNGIAHRIDDLEQRISDLEDAN